jgi:hypothetical protein
MRKFNCDLSFVEKNVLIKTSFQFAFTLFARKVKSQSQLQ